MDAPTIVASHTAAPAETDAWTLLCVDDEPNILSALRRLFRGAGYRLLTAGSGAEGLAELERESVDLVISDMRMPGMDGAQFLGQVRERWPDTVRLLLTGHADIKSTIAAINAGEILRYLAKPWNDDEVLLTVREALERKALVKEKRRLEALTRRQNTELRRLNESLEAKVEERTAELADANRRLKTGFLTAIKVFSSLIEMRGGGLAGHARRVADLARRIAIEMRLPDEEVQDVFVAALLHDIGKIGFADDLLGRPMNQLQGSALAQYRRHPVQGERALMPLVELRGAAALLRAHHERFDGNGFPDGHAGEAIPRGARILAVANDFDGLQSGLAIQPPLGSAEAVEAIRRSSGKRYDPVVVAALVEVTSRQALSGPDEAVVTASHLAPGMTLSRDVVGHDGVLLLAADYVLNDRLIRQLRNYEIAEDMRLVVHVRRNRSE